jgi:LPXTG-site transpeptidase (sortase) family protein
MAAPMVTGAFAILKQADPDLTVSQMKSLLRSMSTKSTNYRAAYKDEIPEKTFDFYTPVLDFSDIEKYMAGSRQGPEFWPVDMPVLPRTGFSALRPEVLSAMPKDLKYEPLQMLLEIPSLDVTAEIVEVPIRKGEYAVTWLGDKAGLLEGFALPGEGQSVLTGHNHLDAKAAGPFAGLSRLKEGDRIFINGERGKIQTFVVYANAKIAETGISAVNQLIAGDPLSLTLITCEDERPEGGYANRRVIAARPL